MRDRPALPSPPHHSEDYDEIFGIVCDDPRDQADLAEIARVMGATSGFLRDRCADATPCDTSGKKSGAAAPVAEEPPPPELLDEQELALTPEQLQVIGMISLGQTVVATAQAIGVHRATIYRWRHDPTFAAVLKRRQEDMYSAAVDQMRASLVQAIGTVAEHLNSRCEEDRVRAAFRLLPYIGSPKLRPPEVSRNAPKEDEKAGDEAKVQPADDS